MDKQAAYAIVGLWIHKRSYNYVPVPYWCFIKSVNV